MRALVVGATGATGRLLVEALLKRKVQVRAVVRSASGIPESARTHEHLTLTEASLLELSDSALAEHVNGCQAVASCLGHNLNFKGIYGEPRRLVTEATARLCTAIKANNPTEPTRFVLMNTTGNRNLDLNEKRSFGDKMVIGLLRGLLPPQLDNEQAANHLRTAVGRDSQIGWVAVRPDGLVDENQVSDYQLHPSPTRSPIFNAGKTSRINVADFMARLMTEDELWQSWQGQMPVIYNKG